ncbi:hypothetical protein BJX99DRAFT_257803 [Aspergillus californicus]
MSTPSTLCPECKRPSHDLAVCPIHRFLHDGAFKYPETIKQIIQDQSRQMRLLGGVDGKERSFQVARKAHLSVPSVCVRASGSTSPDDGMPPTNASLPPVPILATTRINGGHYFGLFLCQPRKAKYNGVGNKLGWPVAGGRVVKPMRQSAPVGPPRESLPKWLREIMN